MVEIKNEGDGTYTILREGAALAWVSYSTLHKKWRLYKVTGHVRFFNSLQTVMSAAYTGDI